MKQVKAPDETKIHLLTSRQKMLWSDMDAFGHLNNVRYFTYFEQARADWMVALNLELENPNQGFIIVNNFCEYRKVVHFPSTLLVDLYGGEVGNASFMTHYEMRREEDPKTIVAVASAKVVWMDYRKGKAIPIPPDIRQHLQAAT